MINLSKNKILFITPSFSRGGAEKNILNIINSLSNNDYEIDLVICTNENEYSKLLNKKINIFNLNKPNVLRSISSIFKILKNRKPDLVFTSALHLTIPIVFFNKILINNYKIITRIPSLPSNKLGNSSIKVKLLDSLISYCLNQSHYVIAQSDQMRSEILNYYKVKPEKVIAITNIVDRETIFSKSQEKIDIIKSDYCFIASGSLYSVKGFDILIKAFSEHIKTYPSTKLLILGEESVESGYKKYLEQLIIDLKLEKSVVLLGHKNNPYKYYKFSDSFVLSSIKEGFPNVVLENLVLQKPILATNCVEYGDILNEKNSIIIEKSSISELITGLEKIRLLKPINNQFENFDFNIWFNKIINESSTNN